MDIKAFSEQSLLSLHNAITEELKDRGVTRTRNNPTGDYAEYLFCKAFGWQQETNSKKSIDATDRHGTTYQIKARKKGITTDSRQLSAIRNLTEDSFDYLAGLIFNPDYSVYKAALIPIRTVLNDSTYSKHTNAWKFFLKDHVWDLPEVKDVTEVLKNVRNPN
jgi:hypothetical protein